MLPFQSQPIEDFALTSNRIDVWFYSLLDETQITKMYLNFEEQQRAARFHFKRHQRRFTNAHGILRLILAQYLNTHPSELMFSSGQYGKPYLLNTLPIEFNLSHSGDTALLVVGYEHPNGVDLEHFSSRPYQGIGENLFSNLEMQYFDDMPSPYIPLSFFNIWSQKEAFIKACGLGLHYPTQSFDVPLLSLVPKNIYDGLHQKEWKMVSFMPQISCCAALCYHPVINLIRYKPLSSMEIEQWVGEK